MIKGFSSKKDEKERERMKKENERLYLGFSNPARVTVSLLKLVRLVKLGSGTLATK